MTVAAATAQKPITLLITKDLPATVERVYAAFADPTQFTQWFGPEGVSVERCAMDFRVGGAWDCLMKTPDGANPHVSGVYKEIVPNTRLVFTWAWDQEDGKRGHETVVVLDFQEKADGMVLRLEQSSFQAEEFRDKHNFGWSGSFVCLEKFLAA